MRNTVYEVFVRHKTPILIALISEIIILFFFGRLSAILFPQSRAAVLNIWDLWNVWDAPHYISIAAHGYQTIGDEANFIVFLPALPLSIFISKLIFQTNYLISGYIAAFIIIMFLAVMLYKLTLLDYPKKTAMLAILMLFIFPTSFFLHIPYSESLLVLLAVAAFYFVRKKYYWRSFLCIGLATATKIAGLALIPAIFLEILIFDRDNFSSKNIFNKASFIFFGSALSLSGFLIYLFINYFFWGDFWYFIFIQKHHWFENFSPFGQGLISAYQSLFWRAGMEKIMLGYAQIVAFIFALFMSIYVLFKVRISYGIFMLIDLFFSYSMSFWISMPRHILTLFPMYIALALFSNNLIFRYFWIIISVILLLILTFSFMQYGPVL
ncbi:MAG: hypothetical protein PHV63_00415 [Candidatus Daviesbacteria bacterium]|nr:hypothetical protein [Candidatus Daviesbacteria bacterium]